MRTLLISCGNSLRRDDGAAHQVLQLLAPSPSRVFRAVQQLTPELAEELAPFDRVVILDADVASNSLAIEPLSAATSRSPLAHFSLPAEIVSLSRALFGFTGEAFLCRIPAHDFSSGASLSAAARQFAAEAAVQLENLL